MYSYDDGMNPSENVSNGALAFLVILFVLFIILICTLIIKNGC